ncbi:uncharacterized protein TNIN_10521 [Trichonephila inaurata madagascariensis]|uniref:Uncharacterized protein n=1 Tax=Trichonephila inaurata madagascariensis TaxID=2747483 RepID=A0A8X6WNJ9_9ARAC|nr:uncharacterized protein TNIN_10521 [Trichonephila inaurata madagascariensis]
MSPYTKSPEKSYRTTGSIASNRPICDPRYIAFVTSRQVHSCLFLGLNDYNTINVLFSLQSQCVNCPFLALQGYTAFPRNMTPAQAQCMIQKCQDGVKQTSVYLGRKKREENSEPVKETDEHFIPQHKTNKSEKFSLEKNMQVMGEIDVYVDEFYDEEIF